MAFRPVGWYRGYINTGFVVFNKIHQPIFDPIEDGQYWTGWGSDDIHLGYQIHRFGFKVHELSYKWNHMTMFSEPWNGSPSRFDSYIIHYAGHGVWDKSNRVEQIAADIERIYG
jgi:hypothetical protein